jgi:hypothetical protein
MSKKKFDFDSLERENDWDEYRKSSKKKKNHRENVSSDKWKKNSRDYMEDDYEEDEYRGRSDRW